MSRKPLNVEPGDAITIVQRYRRKEVARPPQGVYSWTWSEGEQQITVRLGYRVIWVKRDGHVQAEPAGGGAKVWIRPDGTVKMPYRGAGRAWADTAEVAGC